MEGKLCKLCQVKAAKYTCPRCNIAYCCLDCYKCDEHLSCSESFYRDSLVAELKDRKISPEEQRSVMEMLERVEEENPVDNFLEGETAPPIEDRLQGLNINDIKEKDLDGLWQVLTESEQKAFKAALESGKIYNEQGETVAQPWKPWWCEHKQILLEEIDPSKEVVLQSRPPVVDVPTLETMLPKGKSPSPYLCFNLVNVLYPYVLFQRLFNGCGATDFFQDFCDCCITSSDYLASNKTFTNCSESISSAVTLSTESCHRNEIVVQDRALIEAVHDCAHIVMGPNKESTQEYACSALSDLHRAIKQVRSLIKLCKTDETTKTKRKTLFAILKKLEFLLAWCNSAKLTFPILAIELTEVYKSKLSEFKAQNELKDKIAVSKKNDNSSKKPLIVEIDKQTLFD